MSSPPPSAMIAAVMELLKADTGSGGVMTLMTDGVYRTVARSGATKFVLIQQATSRDEYMFEGIAYSEALYVIKAVHLSTSATLARLAADRIFTVLQDAVLPMSGASAMLLQRIEQVDEVELDDENKDVRWQHIGGIYQVQVSPT